MRRIVMPALLLAAVLAAPAAARAESERSMVLELKFGPYKPAIDQEFGGGATPYADAFGDSQVLMTKLEFDYQFFQLVGSLAVAGTVGYSQNSGKGRTQEGEESEDATKMHLIPLSLDLVYRFDYLQRRFNVPLVPLVKGGFDYYIWWVTNGTGDTTGRGGVFGGHATFGLAFLLDWLAPDMAQTFDVDIGVNNTYLFAEYTMAWVDNFGTGKTFDLGSRTFMAGISFEF